MLTTCSIEHILAHEQIIYTSISSRYVPVKKPNPDAQWSGLCAIWLRFVFGVFVFLCDTRMVDIFMLELSQSHYNMPVKHPAISSIFVPVLFYW